MLPEPLHSLPPNSPVRRRPRHSFGARLPPDGTELLSAIRPPLQTADEFIMLCYYNLCSTLLLQARCPICGGAPDLVPVPALAIFDSSSRQHRQPTGQAPVAISSGTTPARRPRGRGSLVFGPCSSPVMRIAAPLHLAYEKCASGNWREPCLVGIRNDPSPDATASAERQFVKMHGLRNHFVIFDRRSDRRAFRRDDIVRICDAQVGVGGDQLLTIEPPSQEAAARGACAGMRIFNIDGREVSACGNATRCVAHLLFEENGGSRDRVGDPGRAAEMPPLGRDAGQRRTWAHWLELAGFSAFARSRYVRHACPERPASSRHRPLDRQPACRILRRQPRGDRSGPRSPLRSTTIRCFRRASTSEWRNWWIEDDPPRGVGASGHRLRRPVGPGRAWPLLRRAARASPKANGSPCISRPDR